MKKFIKTFILAICLILPAMFCLTACGGEKETAKVSSFSVELANTSYTLVDDTITVSYGGDYRLSVGDFSITATFDDETSKTLTSSELKDFGFTISSTIPNDEVTPVGEYTLTFGQKNLAETDFTTIKVNVVKKTVDVNTLGLTWKDEETPFVYDGQYHTNEITNLPEYLEIEGQNDNSAKYPNGAVVSGIIIGSPYYAQVSIKVKDQYADRYVIEGNASIQHEWTIAKAEMEIPSFEFKELTYNGALQNASFTSATAKTLSENKISWSFSGDKQQTNAGTYETTISFKYKGEDKTCYVLGDDDLIGTSSGTWTISPAIIDFSNVYLTSRTEATNPAPYNYNNALTYSKNTEYTVEFGGIECDLALDSDFYSCESLGDSSTQRNAGSYILDMEYTIKDETDRQNYIIIYNEPSNREVVCNRLNSHTVKIFVEWEIKPFEIDTSKVKLKHKVVGSYSDYNDTAFVYDGEEKSVMFDLSSLSEYVQDTIYPFEMSGRLPSTSGRNDIILEYYSGDDAVFSATDADTYEATIVFQLSQFCPDSSNYTISNATITKEWKINQKKLTNLELYLTNFEYDDSTRNYVCEKTLSSANGIIAGDNVTLTIKACRDGSPSNETYQLWYNVDMQGEVEIIACNNSNYTFENGSHGCGTAYVCDSFDTQNGITVGLPRDAYYFIELELEANASMKYRFNTSTDSISFSLKGENLNEISYNDGFTLTNDTNSKKTFVIYMIVSGTSGQGTITMYNHRAVLMDGESVYQTLNVVNGHDISGVESSKAHYTFGGWYTEGNEKVTTITGDITLYGKWTPIEYAITYTNTENMANTNPTTYTIETETITLNALADKVDYAFDGWYYGDEKITTIPKGFTGGNITLEARWAQKEEYKPLNYTIDEYGGVTINGFKDGYKTSTSLTIPKAVVEISQNAFRFCEALESITFESGCKLTTISNSAFFKCPALKQIIIPNTVVEMSGYAFQYCEALESVTFESGCKLTTISSCAFADCTALKQITIPKTIVTIDGNAFSGCSSLASVIFEDDSALTTINGYAFANCTSLKQITIPKSVTTIGMDILKDCKALTTVTFEEGSAITTIGSSMFYGCSALTSVAFPSSVTTLGFGVFTDCSALTNIVIPSGVTEIANIMFEGCTSLTSIVIPDGVTSIGWRAFYGCTSLSSIVMPSEIESIGSSAFYGCSALSKIYYKGTAEDWAKISINTDNNDNACLTANNIYYYSENEPIVSGNYWHYVDNVPTAWVITED